MTAIEDGTGRRRQKHALRRRPAQAVVKVIEVSSRPGDYWVKASPVNSTGFFKLTGEELAMNFRLVRI